MFHVSCFAVFWEIEGVCVIANTNEGIYSLVIVSHFADAHIYGCCPFSDCTNRQSFQNLEFWQSEIKKHCSNQNAIKLLVANKIDRVSVHCSAECFVALNGFCFPCWLILVAHCAFRCVTPILIQQHAEVTREEGERFALEHSMLFIETSAKTCYGIRQAFEELALKILEVPSLVQNSGIFN